MPWGTVKKLVHLTSQSARQENTALIPTRNGVGFGFIEADGRQLYFDADAFSGRFDELQVGQPVEFSADPKFAQASAVRLSAAAAPADPGRLNGPPIAAPLKTAADEAERQQPATVAKPPSPARPAAARPKKAAADDVAFQVAAKNQCLFVARYQKTTLGAWRRVGTLPQIETYSSDISGTYREPLLTLVTPERAVVRMYHEAAVDLKRVTDLLGDFVQAQARCDKQLLERFPGDRLEDDGCALPTW